MKKYALLLIVLTLVTCLLWLVGCEKKFIATDIADDYEELTSDELEFTVTEKGVIINGLKSDDVTDVIIPQKIGDIAVVEIADGAFQGNTAIKKLSIPNSVEKIGYGILSECGHLAELSLPFTGEKHRTEKELSDRPFGYIFGEKEYAGGEATMQFYHDNSDDEVEMVYNCIPVSLKKVTISGKDDTHIPYGAFYNCENIEEITLGKDIKSIGAFAFSGVVGKITWDNPTITEIGEHAFEDYKGTSLSIPETVTEIKAKGYSACVYVKSFVIPDSVTAIGEYAFSYNYDLESVNFGKSVKTLGEENFYFCYNLTAVTLNDGLTTIDDGAFESCRALTAIEIPKSVTRINANAFKNCAKLKSALFRDANGWRCYNTATSGNGISASKLSDKTTAATYLTQTYLGYIWQKA